MPLKPHRLLTPAEIVAALEALSFDELVDLQNETAATRGEEAYIVQASQWFNERTKHTP